MIKVVSRKELSHLLLNPILAEELSFSHGCSYLVVDPATKGEWPKDIFQGRCPIIGLGREEGLSGETPIDVFCEEGEIDALTQSIKKRPEASAVACQVIRNNSGIKIIQGLLTESLAYALLLESSSFKSWLAQRKQRAKRQNDPSDVSIRRSQGTLDITLNRPHAHNAYSERLKDKFCEALQLPIIDNSIRKVIITGNGKSFCSGGDLDEFGSVVDPASSHISRITRSAGNLLSQLQDRTHFRVHGACIGAGIELTAFGGSIVAHPDSFFQLPEVSMGLIPGAGGTVSINKRIGRHRTAFMALTGNRIDSETALKWGLVDELLA
jgi:hypothetical protein